LRYEYELHTPATVKFFAANLPSSLCRLQKLDDSSLFLACNISAETHVMNDYIPLSVTVHGGRSNVVAPHAIVGPKLFTTKAHERIARDRTARFRSGLPVYVGFGKHIPVRAGEE
jgi:hypothetical protein